MTTKLAGGGGEIVTPDDSDGMVPNDAARDGCGGAVPCSTARHACEQCGHDARLHVAEKCFAVACVVNEVCR